MGTLRVERKGDCEHLATVAGGFRPDPATQDVFSPNGEGTLTVVHENSPDDYAVTQTLATQHGARTVALDAASHRLYLPTAEFGPASAPSADQPHPRPGIVDGTFTVLVVARP